MQRIAIIGSAGSGKSLLARQLGEILGIEVIHLDRLYWRPGWVETPLPEFAQLQEELVQRDRWIIDGNYGGTMGTRLAAADTVIFLDLPRTVCLWRVFRRAFAGRFLGATRPDMTDGCQELFDWRFFLWIWTFPRRVRPGVLARLAALPDTKTVIRSRSPQQVEAFLREVGGRRTGVEAGRP